MNVATFDLDEPPPKSKSHRQTYNGITSSLHQLFNGLPNKKYKYIFARDRCISENGEKKYVKEFFQLTSLPNVKKALKKDDNLYEVLWSRVRKLYYDFDDIDYTHEEADKFIMRFVKLLELELNIIINHEELIVLKNENKTKSGETTDKIHSLHIIITNYKSLILDQFKLARYLNAKYNIGIDECVYRNNNQFRLLHQSKLINGCILVNYYEGDINIKKSLINNTEKCKSVGFNKQYDIIEFYKDQADEKSLCEITEDELVDFILGNLNKEPTFDRNKFFNDNQDWKATTNIIFKLKLGFYGNSKQFKFDIDAWNNESVRIGNNEKYTYERNKNYIDKIDEFIIRSGIPMLCKIISKYSSHNLYTTPSIVKDHTIKFLRKYYKDDTIKDIKEEILVIKKTKQIDKNEKVKLKPLVLHIFKTKDDMETTINVKTGFITFKDNRNPINMFYDELPPIHESIFINVVETIADTKKELVKFLNDDKQKIFIVKSRWGTGKTSNIINHTIQTYKDKNGVLITESNTLNNKMTKDCEDNGFVSHLQAQKDPTIKLHKCPRVICSIQSSYKIKSNNYTFGIVDEYESVNSSFTATKTFLSANTTPERAFNTLMNILQRCDKVIITDCDISEDKVNILKHYFGEAETTIIKNNEKAFQDFDINIMTDREQAIDKLTRLLYDENKKIAVPSATKSLIAQIEEAIINMEKKDTECKKIKMLIVHQEHVMIIHDGVKKEYDKEDILKDIEPFIIEHNIQLFLYSPTIKTGVSINSSYFDITFGFASSYSILYNEFLQMVFRQRRLNDKEVIICIPEREFANNKRNKHIDDVRREQHTNKEHYKFLNKEMIIYDTDDVSSGYYDLQTINNKNATNSRNNYAYNFFQLLQYHNLKYTYTTSTSYEEQVKEICNYKIDIDEAIQTLYEDNLNKWINTKLLTYKQYNKIFSKPHNDRYTDLTKDTILQYNKTATIYKLFKLKNKLKPSLKAIDSVGGVIDNTYIMSENWTGEDGDDDIDYKQFEIDDLTDEQEEQLEATITHILKNNGFNNCRFYDKYIKDNQVENIDCIYKLFDRSEIYYTATDEDDKMFQKTHSEKLLQFFGLYDKREQMFKPKKYTNKQFKTFIIKHLDFFKSLYTKIVKKNIVFDVKSKTQIKMIYHKIKQILLFIDVHIHYKDPNHTARDFDTFLITNRRPDNSQIYRYNTRKQSDTLNHIYDNNKSIENQFIIEDTGDYYTVEEIEKRLKKIKLPKKEGLKIQKSLLYHRLTDSKHDIYFPSRYNNREKKDKEDDDECDVDDMGDDDYGDDEDDIEIKQLFYNPSFYNPLLEMITIDNKIKLNDIFYDILNKKDNYSTVINKRDNKSVKLFKYETKTRTYFKPYDIKPPTIETTTNEHYDKTMRNIKDDDKKAFELTQEQIINRIDWYNWEHEKLDDLTTWEHLNIDIFKTTIARINELFNYKAKCKDRNVDLEQLNINKKKWMEWKLEIYGIEPQHNYVGYNFYAENKQHYLYWDIRHLDINQSLMDEIKQQTQISVLGY